MHRTEGDNHSGNLFTDGPPGTTVEENFLNAVQEELCNVIETAGITLKTASTETRDQLLAALSVLYIEFPSGTIMLFGQTSPPAGWTRKADWQDNAMLCYAAAGAIGSGGAVDPQAAHTHTGPSHTHSIGNHVHKWFEANTDPQQTFNSAGNAANLACGSTGGSYECHLAAWNDNSKTCVGADGYTDGGSGSTGAGGTGATGSNALPHYQEIIAAIRD